MSSLDIQITPVEVGFENPKILAAGLNMMSPAGDAAVSTRLLSVEMLPFDDKSASPSGATSRRFVARLYDYHNERSLVATGRLAGPGNQPEVESWTESAQQPLPDWDEFQAAVEVLRGDALIGPALKSGALQPYRPMPPMAEEASPSGRTERSIRVGLLPSKSTDGATSEKHEIVAVHLGREVVERFERSAPRNSLAAEQVCGAPNAGQPTAGRGTPGQYEVVVTDNGAELWRFLAVRPAASSGTNGSGIELIGVRYQGKLVLGRAHAPILNVLYASGSHGCGPAYRDWQYEEGMIRAHGIDAAPGFRRCAAPAKTIFESGSDQGNFLGVALYEQGSELVLVSELEAGWYRYVSEWRFDRDGTIRPRFGFAGVDNSCVCQQHHHHVYWRFDFDVDSAEHNRVREFNHPPLVGPDNWHTLEFEVRRERDATRGRYWQVENTQTGTAWVLQPGQDDGRADAAFGVGDVWALRAHSTAEYDDGQGFTTDPALARAQLDRFLNGEPIHDHDIVLWYAGHFTHDVNDHEDRPHIVGPVLRPVNQQRI
jgi:hypothetical protein